MSDSRVMLGVDRLPWLPDEPARARKPTGNLLGWAVGAVLIVAGASYWLGLRTAEEVPPAGQSSVVQPSATVRLPQPAPSPAPAAVPPVTAQRVEPMIAPAIPVVESEQARPRRMRVERAPAKSTSAETAATAETSSADEQTASPDATPAPVAPPAKPVYSGPWPVRVVEGASGRMIRVGTFRTPRQAKKGWWAIVKMNPALKTLPALVVPVASLRDGGLYYRLQMGTTSQAHSQVLCQRMRMIGQSCVVIDERRGGR